MSTRLDLRVAAIEKEIAIINRRLEAPAPREDWLDGVFGAFANDPHFESAMDLGRAYRESLAPKRRQGIKKAKTGSAKVNGHPR